MNGREQLQPDGAVGINAAKGPGLTGPTIRKRTYNLAAGFRPAVAAVQILFLALQVKDLAEFPIELPLRRGQRLSCHATANSSRVKQDNRGLAGCGALRSAVPAQTTMN